jgi:MinD superfamily P-loop ATPase
MRVAVASGKGGTGKTTVAVNLAVTAARVGMKTAYVDCDVEEPNGHIYLKPGKTLSRPVAVGVPRVDESRCTLCGECAGICKFNAIAVLGGQVLVFPELCHGCGGCFLVCPAGALTESQRQVGDVETGVSTAAEADGREILFLRGNLRVGEAMPLPVIREVKKRIPDADLVVVDCPPGNACPMVESVRGCDRVLLVTEPTPFGLHDLKIAVETVSEMGIPVDVVMNRCDPAPGDRNEELDCGGAEVMARIHESREIAEIGSRGKIASLESENFASVCGKLLRELTEKAAGRVR